MARCLLRIPTDAKDINSQLDTGTVLHCMKRLGHATEIPQVKSKAQTNTSAK